MYIVRRNKNKSKVRVNIKYILDYIEEMDWEGTGWFINNIKIVLRKRSTFIWCSCSDKRCLSILIIERNYKCNLLCIRININNVFSFAIFLHICTIILIHTLTRARFLNIILSLKSYRLKTFFVLTTIFYKPLSVLRTRNRMEDLGDSCCVRHLKYSIYVTYLQGGSMKKEKGRMIW